MADYYNNIIHKVDAKGKLLAIKDMTNEEWDVTDNNKYIIEFVEYGNNNHATKKVKFFIDADMLTAFLGQITSGNYSKSVGWQNIFAGSKSAISKRKVNGNMQTMVDGIESRTLSIGVNKSGYFVFKVDVKPGRVGGNGQIKPAGDSVDNMYFSLDKTQAVVLAKAVETYTTAKKTLGISNYLKTKKERIANSK